MMSKLIYLIMVFCLVSCGGGGDDVPNPGPDPTPENNSSQIILESDIDNNGVFFTEEGGEKTVNFETNEYWELSFDASIEEREWLTLSQTKGSKGSVTITLFAKPNESYERRSVPIIIEAGKATKRFMVVQKQIDAILIDNPYLEAVAEESVVELEVEANIDYTVTIKDTWVTQVSSSASRHLHTDKLYFKIAANTLPQARQASIFIADAEQKISQEVIVVQDAYHDNQEEDASGNVDDMPWGN